MFFVCQWKRAFLSRLRMVYIKNMRLTGTQLNPIAECKALRWGLWQCPPFLFLLMGIITIVSMVATYVLASQYIEEPELAALVVIFIAVLFLILGNIIITGFNKVAETNRMKSEFISIVSHQLRSPLSVFKWTIDVLERQMKKQDGSGLDGPSQNFLQTLRSTSENMISLVNSLLEMSRIEARTFMLREERFSLLKLTQDMINNFFRYAESSHIYLKLRVEGEIPEIIGDRERVAIVVQNFIDNAIRYTDRAGEVPIRITKENGFIHWSIKDHGIGIPPAQQKFIFQKFFRAGNIKTANSLTQTHGTGIGLYVSKEVIEASKGKIGFSSEEGKGSTFWFTLPIK